MIVCFTTTTTLNVYNLNDELAKRQWSLNALQHPACLHLCCTLQTAKDGVATRFLTDLRDALTSAKEKNSVSSSSDKKNQGQAAIYGMTRSMPNGPVTAVMQAYNDIQLSVN